VARSEARKACELVTPSIREFGFAQPIVVDKDSVIIVGHTRLKAAQKLGLERVPVVVASYLTPDQVRAYRIADNKLNELAEWNDDLSPIEISAFKEANYELGVLGFDAEELAKNDQGNEFKDCVSASNLAHGFHA